jgi:hypothetical protein
LLSSAGFKTEPHDVVVKRGFTLEHGVIMNISNFFLWSQQIFSVELANVDTSLFLISLASTSGRSFRWQAVQLLYYASTGGFLHLPLECGNLLSLKVQ